MWLKLQYLQSMVDFLTVTSSGNFMKVSRFWFPHHRRRSEIWYDRGEEKVSCVTNVILTSTEKVIATSAFYADEKLRRSSETFNWNLPPDFLYVLSIIFMRSLLWSPSYTEMFAKIYISESVFFTDSKRILFVNCGQDRSNDFYRPVL